MARSDVNEKAIKSIVSAACMSAHDEDPTVFPQVAKQILSKADLSTNKKLSLVLDLRHMASKRFFDKNEMDEHDVQFLKLVLDIDSGLHPYLAQSANFLWDLGERAKKEERRDIFNVTIAALSILCDEKQHSRDFRNNASHAVVSLDPFWGDGGRHPG